MCDMMISEPAMSPVDMNQVQPISRTYQYRKVTKPTLERQRRARINRCLDELKDLMVSALTAEGDKVNKLEKADILELTVNHLHRLRREQRLAANPVTDADRFRAGFSHCAREVSLCLSVTPGVDVQLGTKVLSHLAHRLNELDKVAPLSIQVAAPASTASTTTTPAMHTQTPPASPVSSCPSPAPQEYPMPLTPASSRNSASPRAASPSMEFTGGLLKVVDYSVKKSVPVEPMWRPW